MKLATNEKVMGYYCRDIYFIKGFFRFLNHDNNNQNETVDAMALITEL